MPSLRSPCRIKCFFVRSAVKRLRIEQALQVVGPRSVTSHIRRQALERAAESLQPTFALEFPRYEERPRGSVVAFALRASAP